MVMPFCRIALFDGLRTSGYKRTLSQLAQKIGTTSAYKDTIKVHVQTNLRHHKDRIDDASNDASKDDKGPSEFELNLGEALRGLGHDLEAFPRQSPVYTHIYRNDIILSDPHHTRLQLRGIRSYFALIQGLRWTLRWYYGREGARVRVLHVRAPTRTSLGTIIHARVSADDPGSVGNTPEEDTSTAYIGHPDAVAEARIRWRFQVQSKPTPSPTTPSVLKDLTSFAPLKFPSTEKDNQDTTSDNQPPANTDTNTLNEDMTTVFEGVFVYKFDANGRICEHRVEHLEPTPGPHLLEDWRVRLLRWWPNSATGKPALGYVSTIPPMRRPKSS